MNRISEYQLTAGRSVIETYDTEDKPWHMLFAQPQSGKTDTYYYVAAEMLRTNKVDDVIVICGASDIQLKKQCMRSLCDTKGGMDFCEKYDCYLETALGLDRTERFNAKRKLKAKTIYYWGNELLWECTSTTNTLFIWDESHFAQSIDMRPFKFFKSIGISCDGEKECLKRNNNFVLSVSATPFTEISHILRQKQTCKGITFLETDKNYHGISNVLEKNLLIPFEKKEMIDMLTEILRQPNHILKYGIIRVFQEKDSIDIVKVAKQNGWNSLRCNSDPKKRDISNLSVLNSVPEKNTLIIIKGMCRMGQVIEKRNVAFVMETSNDSNTETVIQGLLGRTLGWHKSEIKVYVSSKIISRGDIDVYVKLCKGDKVLPRKANNIKCQKSGEIAETNNCDVFCGRKEKDIKNKKDKKDKKIRLVIEN